MQCRVISFCWLAVEMPKVAHSAASCSTDGVEDISSVTAVIRIPPFQVTDTRSQARAALRRCSSTKLAAVQRSVGGVHVKKSVATT